MAEKKIEIRMAVAGAEETAAKIRSVSDAGSSMGDDLSARFAAAKQKAQELSESLNDTGSSLEKNVSSIDMRTRAEAVAGLGRAFGHVQEFAQKAADQLREADPKMAASLDNVSQNLNRVSSAATLAAQGFAVGGPLGGAIGGLVGAALPDLKNAFDDLVVSLGNLAEAEKTSEDLTKRLQVMQEMGPELYQKNAEAARAYKQETDDLNRSLDLQIQALRDRNEILDATDKAKAADRDAQDAARIRAGVPEEDVKADRVKYDASVEVERIKRRREEVVAQEDAAREKLAKAKKNIGDIENNPDGVDKKQLEEAQRKYVEAERAFQDASNRTSTVFTKTEQEISAVNTTAGNKVTALQESKTERLQREKEKKERDEKREAEKRKREKEREENAAESEAAQRTRQEAGLGRSAQSLGKEAADLLPKRTRDRFEKALEFATAKLQDGDQGGEVERLADLVSGLANAVNGKNRSLDVKIQQLESQIKNMRNPNK